MARTRKQAEQAAKPKGNADDKQAEEGSTAPAVRKTSKLAGFTSHGKRYKHLTIPRDLHDALPEEGQRYEVAVEDGGVVVFRPVAAA